jgi:hypothetical protein
MVDSGAELVSLRQSPHPNWTAPQRTRFAQLAEFRRLSQVPNPTAPEVAAMDSLRTTLGYTAG